LLAKGLQVEQSRAEQSGDAERSLALAEEVLAIRSKLAAARPDDARVAREAMLAELARGRALVRAGRAADAVAGLQAACTTATERVERAPDSHEALSDRALGYESLAQTLEEIGRAPEALERTQLARADLARAAQLAPESELYPRRGAYLASREAKTLVGLGRIAEAAATSSAASEVFEGILAKGAPAADVLQQAAVLFAITSGTSMKAGDAASAERWAVRARAVLAAMPEARRKNIEPFVTAEIGK
jgi:tetratricopeptide (TPR) repeat protein